MGKLLPQLLAVLVIASMVLGCGGEEQASPIGNEASQGPTIDQLLASWRNLANAPADKLDLSRAVALASELARQGEQGRLIDVLGGKDETPVAKVLAVVSLSPVLSADMIDRLAALTSPENEVTTRAGATSLLATMLFPDMRPPEIPGKFVSPTGAQLEDIRGLLRELGDDPEFRVKLAALGGLSRTGDPEAADALAGLWNTPNLRPADRMEIFRALPNDNPQPHKKILMDAAQDTNLDPEIRVDAISYLGRIPEDDVLPVVDGVAKNDPSAGVREMAAQAAAALRARLGSNEPAQSETPPAPADDSGEG